jgi:hypothetical protein
MRLRKRLYVAIFIVNITLINNLTLNKRSRKILEIDEKTALDFQSGFTYIRRLISSCLLAGWADV